MKQLIELGPEVFRGLASLGGRAAALLVLGWVVALVLAGAAAEARRRWWAAVLVGLLLLPLTSALLPELPLELPAPLRSAPQPAPSRSPPEAPPPLMVDPARPAAVREGIAVPPERSPLSRPPLPRPPASPHGPPERRAVWPLLLLMIWAAGALVLVIRALRGQHQAARLRRSSRPLADGPWSAPAGIDVRSSEGIDLPMTVGLWRPAVLLPAGRQDWPAGWQAAVLAHEAAHVRRRDPLLELCAELACALHWMNPLVWLAARRLRIERELAADDAVLQGGTPGSDYARCLLALSLTPGATSPAPAAAVGSLFQPAGLRARLDGVLDRQRRRRAGRAVSATLALGLGAAFLPLAAAVPRQLPDPPGRPPNRAPETDVVIGRAVGAPGPLAGVAVDFYLRGDSPQDALRVVSDAQGYFRLPRTSFVPRRFVVYLRQGKLAARTPILPVPYGTELPRTIELRPAPSVTGIVRGEGGRPLSGAEIRFHGAEGWAVAPGWEAVATTGADGRFRLDGVLYGNYRLMVGRPDGPKTMALVRVETRDTIGLDITVPDAWRVSGRLLDENGAPLAGARLVRRRRGPPGERHVDWDESAADGSFRLLAMGGRIRAEAWGPGGPGGLERMGVFSDGGQAYVVEDGRGLPGRLVWRSGPSEPRVVILRRPVHLSGTARLPDGSPAVAAEVFASHRAGDGAGPVLTDQQGRFRIGPLEPGRINVVARLPGGDPGRQRPIASMRWVEASSSQDDVDLVVRPAPERPGPLRAGARRAPGPGAWPAARSAGP